MTLLELTETMCRYNQFAAPGSECNVYQDYCEDCWATLGHSHDDDAHHDDEVPDEFARWWLGAAAGEHEDYDSNTGERIS